MALRRPVPPDHAHRLRAFAADFRCVHAAEVDPAHAEAVLGQLERPGHYLALFASERPIDHSPPATMFLFASEPLDGIAAYETLALNDVTRRLGDLMRSGRVAKIAMAGGVKKEKATNA